jgi:PIN domain nuclease of toxin-antitoxin system
MTKVLLDTIAFYFLMSDIAQIPRTAEGIITDVKTKLFLSIVSVWELSIQVAQGKIAFAKPFQEAISDNLAKYDIEIVDISLEDTHVQALMPFLTIHGNVHKDPFDRLIVAQAIGRNLLLCSSDKKLPFYPVSVLWE